MKLTRRLVIVSFVILIIGAGWLWWNLPKKVDMADYAPADSFVYLEANSIGEITAALERNDTWRALGPVLGTSSNLQNHWLSAIARAGIGPAGSVILARAQIALVIVGMNTSEDGDTLRIKPEAALIVETHTSQRRVRSALEETVKRIAAFAYGQAACAQHTESAEYLECVAPAGDRRIVAALEGTLVVIGNSKTAVESCLEVRRGQRPSLRTDADLLRMRSNLNTKNSLASGYVSSANAAKLFSWAAPLLMGKTPGDRQLEQLLGVSAAKILHGIAWSSESSGGGIEDRFLFSLEPSVVERLRPAFLTGQTDDEFWKFVPQTFQSLTLYRSEDPQAAWVAMNSAVSSKLDTLSAVIFATILRSALAGYGITNPQELLTSVSPPLVTLRPDTGAEGSILIARIRDREKLRHTLVQLFSGGRGQVIEGVQSDPHKEFAALIVDNYVIVGKSENVQRCILAIRNKQIVSPVTKLQRVVHFAPNSSAAIITYTNDEARISSFVSVLSSAQSTPLSPQKGESLKTALGETSFAATETNLSSIGIERRTRSAFGQFSTLLSLLEPDRAAPTR